MDKHERRPRSLDVTFLLSQVQKEFPAVAKAPHSIGLRHLFGHVIQEVAVDTPVVILVKSKVRAVYGFHVVKEIVQDPAQLAYVHDGILGHRMMLSWRDHDQVHFGWKRTRVAT